MKDALGGVQTVLLLGGTSEIGLAAVRALELRPGATVVLAGRDPVVLAAAGTRLRPVRVVVREWDARIHASHDGFIDAVCADVGDLDVVIAAAGVLGEQAAFEAGGGTAGAVELLETNLVGVAAACLSIARRLRMQGHGTLVVLSSVAGVRARRANFVYGASKAGLDAFAHGLGDALHGTGARVLVVRPGFVRTAMTAGLPDAPLTTTPDVVGAAVADAVRTGRALTYVPGVLRWVFAGLRLLPRPLWRRLPG